MLTRLWRDTCGAIVAPEVCIFAAILVIGIIVGIVSVRTAIDTELRDVGKAIETFDFTPELEPVEPDEDDDEEDGDEGDGGNITAADVFAPPAQ